MSKKRKDFLIFGSPLIERPEIDEVLATLESGWVGTGPRVQKFEEMFKKYKGSRFAAALSSCTAALHLSMLAIGAKRGDEVILPAMTFAGTANAVIQTGARPVFVDCQRDTFNIEPEGIKKKINPRTKAIIPVHFAGRPANMDEIMKLARKFSLKVVEDCAHAIEAEYHGRKAGTFGELGCFSFYVTKNITTAEGGMVITDNPRYDEKIKILALQGMTKDAWKRFSDKGYKHYKVVYSGYKYNMTDIQAAIGIHQLPRINKYWKRRQEIWNKYNEAFGGLPVLIPAPVEADTRHAYHLYTLLLDINRLKISRDGFLDAMAKRNIGTGVHYIALHLHPYYQKKLGYRWGDFPNAEWISERTVSCLLYTSPSPRDS